MITPIQMRIMAAGGGEAATLSFNADREGSSYNPSTPGSFVPAADDTMVVYGIYEVIPEEGVVTDLKARFMFAALALIPRLESDDAKVTVGGVTYLAKKVRRRVFMGKIDGYSMNLEKG